MEIEQLEQVRAIADCGTLSGAAQQLHVSQSALSRSIQRLEAELDISLFDRTKNHMSLNEAGELVQHQGRIILSEVARLRESLAELARKRSTLRVGACSPAPLWRMVPAIAEREPDLIVAPEMLALKDIEHDLLAGVIDMGILPYQLGLPNVISVPIMDEHLYVALPTDHALADQPSVSFADLDGTTFLLYQGVGFWLDMTKREMPNAHYVVQDDYLIYSRLAQTSPLPSFVTDVSAAERTLGNKHVIPVTDAAASVTHYLTVLDTPDFRWKDLLVWLEERLLAW